MDEPRYSAAGPGSVSSPVSPSCGLDEYASTYEDEIQRSIAFARQGHEFYMEVKARLLIALYERHVAGVDEPEVLDVGCGIGLTDRLLVDRVRQLHGTDISPAMLERAQAANPTVQYERCEADRLPYPDERFDLVFAICVVHHVARQERPAFVSEMCRVTRRGGIVTVFEHNPWNPLTRRAVHSCRLDDHTRLVAHPELRRLLADADLEIVEAAYLLFTPWRGRLFARLDRALGPLPLGAQHFVAARRA